MTNYTTRDAESVRLLPLTFAERTRRVAKRHAELAALRLLDAAVLRKWEYPLVESMHNGVNVECEGDLLVKDVHKALAHLDNNGYERSAHQRLFHRAFMMASLEQFYRGDLQRNLVRLLSDFGVSELHSEVAIMTPRRFGKTWGVAMWAASMLVMGRDHDTCIYSTGSRVSKMMLQTIMRMVRVLAAKFGGNIVSINKNEECVFETAAGYTNSIHAYPAKSDTLRGTGSKRRTGTVILEEAAFIAPDVSLSIVAPTLTRKYVNLFAISTINKDDMVMSSFMTATYPDGRAVMLSLNFALVCSACRESGRADTCQHMLGDLPHWSSTQQHQKLAALMRQSQETLQREIRGVDISENVRPAFNAAAIGALNDAVMGTLRAPLRTQSHVFVTIDPACGGSNSAMALVSFVFVDNMAVVSIWRQWTQRWRLLFPWSARRPTRTTAAQSRTCASGAPWPRATTGSRSHGSSGRTRAASATKTRSGATCAAAEWSAASGCSNEHTRRVARLATTTERTRRRAPWRRRQPSTRRCSAAWRLPIDATRRGSELARRT